MKLCCIPTEITGKARVRCCRCWRQHVCNSTRPHTHQTCHCPERQRDLLPELLGDAHAACHRSGLRHQSGAVRTHRDLGWEISSRWAFRSRRSKDLPSREARAGLCDSEPVCRRTYSSGGLPKSLPVLVKYDRETHARILQDLAPLKPHSENSRAE